MNSMAGCKDGSHYLNQHRQRLNHDQVSVIVTRGSVVAIECLLLWIR